MTTLIQAVWTHMTLTLAGVGIAVVIGVITGIIISKKPFAAVPVLTVADVIQTIPSLSLLALLMVVFGLGNTTLIIGLCLYSLLPVIRNTFTGLSSISPSVKEAARGMGMSAVQSLLLVEIPLAMPMIFSGIRIALVTALGTAVIGVLIGSGGLGYIIYGGIQSQNWVTVMQGTIPVVLLSLAAQYGFNALERLQRRRKTNA